MGTLRLDLRSLGVSARLCLCSKWLQRDGSKDPVPLDCLQRTSKARLGPSSRTKVFSGKNETLPCFFGPSHRPGGEARILQDFQGA